ncbi:MAG: GIDE domain-containing protein [Acidimicrobiales bacterium]
MIWLLAVAPFAFAAAWVFDRRRRVYADLGTTPAAAVSAGRNESRDAVARLAPAPADHRYALGVVDLHTRGGTEPHPYRHQHRQRGPVAHPHRDVPAVARDRLEVGGSSERAARRRQRRRGGDVRRREHLPRVLLDEVFREEDDRGFLARLVSFDNKTGRYQHRERAIAIGDPLFVVGDASMPDGAATPRIDHGQPFVISTRREESHRTRRHRGSPSSCSQASG